ncbi:hypothetical protein B296_00031498 [Ensete ventricosum]|uniref:Uncharacterized protein n=1 Tax=Ensete ventricosum TaxID=4639 RepID=A0A426YIN3_ENSVE|nr:hypothetical protein B296_00031498 [Ensete ventricosum]
MGAMYHRGSSQIVSTSESHGGDLIIQRYDRNSWRVGLLQCSHSLKGARQVRGQSRQGSSASSVFYFIRRIRENQQGSAQLSLTTAVESNWEPKGHVVAKIED